MGISYFNFVGNPIISVLFREAVLSAVALNGLPLSAIQIVYFYGEVDITIANFGPGLVQNCISYVFTTLLWNSLFFFLSPSEIIQLRITFCSVFFNFADL